MSNHDEENKEEFCSACAAVPLAMAGSGAITATSGSSSGKLPLVIFGVILMILGFIFLFFMMKQNPERRKKK